MSKVANKLREYGATLDFAKQEKARELMSVAAAEIERLERENAQHKADLKGWEYWLAGVLV